MDPITHMLVGLGVGALSGQALSPYNPLYCATVLGAVAPDADVLTLLRGKVFFMRHHRGASHSLIGAALISLVVSLIVHVDFAVPLWRYFPWALAGTYSHVFLDSLNSYGSRLWWPLSRKQTAGNILGFIDPLFAGIFLPIIFAGREPRGAAGAAFLAAAVYLLVRKAMRAYSNCYLRGTYGLAPGREKLVVLPSLHGIASWDFRVKRPGHILLGTFNTFRRKVSNSNVLPRQARTEIVEKALQSSAGRFFRQLTALYHFTYWEEKGRLFVQLLDLRFQQQREFFYRLTLIFNQQLNLEEASFHDLKETIPLAPR